MELEIVTNQNGPSAGTEMVLSPRQEKLLSMRDEMGPGATPAPIVPRNFAEAQAMCQALATADLVPRAYRNKPVDMLLVVMTGLEVGLPPMAALRLYTTWDGVARLMAEGIRAVILRHPDIEYFEPQSSSETSATWVARRRNRPEKSATWTIERAKRADLLGKDNWKKYPEDMLNARASMQLGRMIAPDIIAGMISHEEAKDGDFIDASFTERSAETKAAFVAPPAAPVVTVATAPLLTPATAELPKRGPGRPPKVDPTPASPPSPRSSASTSPPASGSTSVEARAASSPIAETVNEHGDIVQISTFDAAVKQVEERKAARAASPTPADSGTGQTVPPPAESAAASTAPTTSGAATAAADDSGFGGDEPAGKTLAQFFAWVAGCKNQRELQAGLSEWRMWSQEQAKAGDTTFSKTGESTVKMQDAYSKRKGEVPA